MKTYKKIARLFSFITAGTILIGGCKKDETPSVSIDNNNITFTSISLARDGLGNVNGVGFNGTSNGVSLSVHGLKSNDPSDKDTVSITLSGNIINTTTNASTSPVSNSAVVFSNTSTAQVYTRVQGTVYKGSFTGATFSIDAASTTEAASWLSAGKATAAAITASNDRITKANSNRYTLSKQ
jgi:hypothetical protein